MNKKTIDFLQKAKRNYYSENISESPKQYEEGSLKYVHTYQGGNNFTGTETLYKDGKPFWVLNYAGRITGDGFSEEFLREALSISSDEQPYRGPGILMDGDNIYKRKSYGDLHWFTGVEIMYHKGFKNNKVFECAFHGGDIK
jgi:hypothetical protein